MTYGQGMRGNAWDRTRGAIDNKDRTRWYGLRPGDIVEERAFGSVRRGKVVNLHTTDQNGCTIKVNGKEGKAVCEWCTVIERVEDRG